MGDKLSVLNENTGEVRESIDSEEGYLAKRKYASDKAYMKLRLIDADTKKMKFYNESLEGFIWSIYDYCSEVIDDKDIMETDFAKILYLVTFINYDNYLMTKNNKMMDKKGLMELLRLSRPRFSEFYNRLIKSGIIVEDDKGIQVNKEMFRKGKLTRELEIKAFSRVYVKTVRYLYESISIRQHKALGVAYRLIPYTNTKTNLVCSNPSEVDTNLLKPLTVSELIDFAGYDIKPNKFKSMMYKLVDDEGYPILGFFSVKGKDLIIMNPRYVYGSNYEDLKGILSIFNTTKDL